MNSLFKIGVFACAIIVSGHLQAQVKAGRLNIAMDDYYPPFHTLNKDGSREGLDIDFANEVCKRLKMQCHIDSVPFENIITNLRFKKFDVIISGISDTPNRRRVVTFSDAYALEENRLAVNKTNENLSDYQTFCQSCPKQMDLSKPDRVKQFNDELVRVFKRKKLVLQSGTTFERYFVDFSNVKFQLDFGHLPEPKEVFSMLADNEADVSIGLTKDILDTMDKEKRKNIVFIGPTITGGAFGKGIAVAVRKTDAVLLEKINNTIREMKADGTLKAIIVKWFGKEELMPK